jgi:hypothetical protein
MNQLYLNHFSASPAMAASSRDRPWPWLLCFSLQAVGPGHKSPFETWHYLHLCAFLYNDNAALDEIKRKFGMACAVGLGFTCGG